MKNIVDFLKLPPAHTWCFIGCKRIAAFSSECNNRETVYDKFPRQIRICNWNCICCIDINFGSVFSCNHRKKDQGQIL